MQRTEASNRGEIEVRLGQLGGDLLDFAATLPLESDGSTAEPDVPIWEASSLSDWDGLEQRVDIPADHAALPVQVRVTVDVVRKQGDAFVVSAAPSPYRRVQIALRSELGAGLLLERIYAGR